MDEPFAALDALTRRQMQDELLKLCEETGSTTLFVTHGIDEAIRVGTRILALTPHPAARRQHLTSRLRAVPVAPRVSQGWSSGFSKASSQTRKPSISDIAAPKLVRTPAFWRTFDATPWRRAAVLAGFALIWELYARWLDSSLLLPTMGATLSALWSAILSGKLPDRTLTSLRVLISGYALGIAIAAVLTTLAALSR